MNFNRRKKIIVIFSILILCFSQVTFATSAPDLQSLNSILYDFTKSNNVPGMSVVITEGNETILEGGFGYNQDEKKWMCTHLLILLLLQNL